MDLSKYTDEQKVGIVHKDGPLLITSCAGSGKTTLLTARFNYLITEYKVNPAKILCITFTNKAGEEIRNRVASSSGIPKKQLHIFTFHGLCNFWLRLKGDLIGLSKNYQIMDASEEEQSIKSICRNTVFNPELYEVYKFKQKRDKSDISEEDMQSSYLEAENKAELPTKVKLTQEIKRKRSKDLSLTEEQVMALYRSKQKLAASSCVALTKYTDYKQKRNLLDFDDLILYGIKLFEVLNLPYEHILCDEAQDCGSSDHTLIQAISRNTKNIVAVGDERQAIFGFRGALPNSMGKLKELFDMKQHHLTFNFRSGKKIIQVANKTIERLKMPETVAAKTHEGEVEYYEFKDDIDELHFILNRIKQICQTS